MNHEIQYNPDGGDLGRTHIGLVEPLQFAAIVPAVAHILGCLYEMEMSKFPFKYAFEFHSYSRKAIELVMMSIVLPPHVFWYETDGLKIFRLTGPSGAITSTSICYLATKP